MTTLYAFNSLFNLMLQHVSLCQGWYFHANYTFTFGSSRGISHEFYHQNSLELQQCEFLGSNEVE